MKRTNFVLCILILALLACNAPLAPGLGTPAPADSTPANATESAVPILSAPSQVGNLIVYTCFANGSDEVCLMNADGSDQRQLTSDPATDWYAALSPDGQTIVFSTRRDGQFELYTMDLKGANLKRLTQNHGDNYAPAYSPDGRRIVFVSTAGGTQDVWVMNTDGSGQTQLTNRASEEYDPVWSPDGKRILFATGAPGANELYVMNADSSGIKQVTSGSDMREGGRSDWSPDGQWIAFYAGSQKEKNIFLMPASCADGDQPCGAGRFKQLTEGGNAKAPSFSPDSQWIAYAAGPTKNNDIYIMRIDGTGQQQLTNGPLSEWQPRWGR